MMNYSLFANNGQRREHDVENRRVFSFDHSQLSLYETFRPAHEVRLYFPNPVLASMLTGKKLMLNGNKAEAFVPGESIVWNGEAHMHIRFPEAEEENPTRCLTLELEPSLIKGTITEILESDPDLEEDLRVVHRQGMVHFSHDAELIPTLERFLQLHLHTSGKFSHMLAGHTLRELVIRLLQTQAKYALLASKEWAGRNRLALVGQYVRDHIHEPISADQLASVACLSKPQFFRRFRQAFGTTPNEFIIQEKLATACRLLQEPGAKVVTVAYQLAFTTPQYFIRLFRARKGITPSQYQKEALGLALQGVA